MPFFLDWRAAAAPPVITAVVSRKSGPRAARDLQRSHVNAAAQTSRSTRKPVRQTIAIRAFRRLRYEDLDIHIDTIQLHWELQKHEACHYFLIHSPRFTMY